MKKVIIAWIVLIAISCKTKNPGLIELTDAVRLPDSSMHLIKSIDSWMQEPLQYKGKTVMLWDIDERHYGRVEAIYDSTGTIYGLIDRIKQHSGMYDTLANELEKVRTQLKSMHDTGKCPFEEQYYSEVVTDSFTLISGCYTKEEHEKELDPTNGPKLEISATISKHP